MSSFKGKELVSMFRVWVCVCVKANQRSVSCILLVPREAVFSVPGVPETGASWFVCNDGRALGDARGLEPVLEIPP